MNELTKPNDIFIAATSGKDIKLEDLYANNINGENTSFYTMDEYKMTPFVQKKYTENGVFNDFAFLLDYLKASLMYKALTDKDAELRFIQLELYYDPLSLNAPLGGRRLDPHAIYTKFKNPLELQVGIELINTWSDPHKTPEEIALGNRIFDSKTGKFLNISAESQNLWDKTMGRTLKYAIWEEDGTHTDMETGEVVSHKAGDWKTDADGKYYTEIMYDEEPSANTRIVSVEDILTKENSSLNKIDFFDSDGYTKSIAGTVFKTAVNIAPYLIPGFNKIYGGVVAATNLAKVLPTFYKSLDSILLGENHTKLYDHASSAENWFSKFNSSKSYEGRKGFWTLENFGELTSDTFSQLYQQKAVASLSKYLKPIVENESAAVTLSRNALGRNLSLGYMALTSTADMYNEAKNAGYSDRAAGIISLASAGALFGVMNTNEAGKGITSWFLDKTDGVDKTVEPHYFRKILMDSGIMKDVSEIEKHFIAGDRAGIKKWLVPMKLKLLKWQHALEGASAGMWSNAFIEGLEETSEELVLDGIKGIADTLAWLGIWKNDTRGFGGWLNVFSKEGLNRYLSTFVGGAFGGALFEAQNKWIEPAFNEELRKLREEELTKDIIDLLVDGKKDDLIRAAKSMRGYFNTDLTALLGTDVSGKAINISANGGKSQADIIIEGVLDRIEEIDNALKTTLNMSEFGNSPQAAQLFKMFHPDYEKEKNTILNTYQKQYVHKKYVEKLNKVVLAQLKVDELKKKEVETASSKSPIHNTPELNAAENALEAAIKEVEEFFNHKLVFENSSTFDLYKMPGLRLALSMGVDGAPGLDINSYTWQKYKKNFNDLNKESNDPSEITKDKVEAEYKIYLQELSLDEFGEQLENLKSLFMAEMPTVSHYLREIMTDEELKAWMLSQLGGELGFANILPRNDGESVEAYEQRMKLHFLDNVDSEVLIYDPDAETLEEFQERRKLTYLLRQLALYDLVKANPKMFSLRDSLYIKYLDKYKDSFKFQYVDADGNFINDDKADEKAEILVKLINLQLGLLGNNTLWTDESLNKVLTNIQKMFDPNTSYGKNNIFVQEYKDILKQLGEDLGVADLERFIENNLIHIDLDNWVIDNAPQTIIEEINSVKLQTILDAVENASFINPDLYQQLANWKSAAIDMLYENIKGSLQALFDDLANNPLTVLWPQPFENYTKEEVVTAFLNASTTLPLTGNEIMEGLQKAIDSGMINDYLVQDLITAILASPLATPLQRYMTSLPALSNKKNALKENPLHKLIENFCRKFNYNSRQTTIIKYLLDKELEINSLKDLESLELEAGELEECLDLMHAVLTHLKGLIQATGQYNSNLQEYAKKYLKNNNGEDYIVLTDDGHKAIFNQLENFDDKLMRLRTLYELKSESKIKTERILAQKINEKHRMFLEEELDEVLPAKSKDADVEDDEFIMMRETEIFNFFLGKTYDEKLDYLKSFIDKYENEGVLENDFSIEDIYSGASIHKNFILLRLVQLMFLSPADLEKAYVEAISNSLPPILYKKDLLLAFNLIFIAHYSKEASLLVDAVNEKLFIAYEELIKSEERDALGNWVKGHSTYNGVSRLKYVSFIPGKAGSGKTSVVAKLALLALLKLHGGEVYVAAPTLDKKNDLSSTLGYANNFTLWESDLLFAKLLTPDSFNKLKGFKDTIEAQFKLGFDLSAYPTGYHEIIIEDPNIGKCVVSFTIETGNGAQDLHYINFDITLNLRVLESNITRNSDLLVYIDEATLLDPLTLHLLQELSALPNHTLNVITSGDPSLLGYTLPITIQGLPTCGEVHTINNYYLNSSPYLESVFRSNNTANTYNINVLGNAVKPYVSRLKKLIERSDSRDTIKQILNAAPLLYNNTTLLGHLLTLDLAEFKTQLKATYDKAKSENKKLFLVTENDTLELELKTVLLSLGISEGDCVFYQTGSFNKHILGAENEYVILYKLPSSNSGFAVSDLQKAYMLASRAKNYTLIFEEQNGLFTDLGIRSEFTDTIYNENIDNTALQNYTQTVITRKNELITKYAVSSSLSNNSGGQNGGPTGPNTPGPTGPNTPGPTGPNTPGPTGPNTPGPGGQGPNIQGSNGQVPQIGPDLLPTKQEKEYEENLTEQVKNDSESFFVDPWYLYLGPNVDWDYKGSQDSVQLTPDSITKITEYFKTHPKGYTGSDVDAFLLFCINNNKQKNMPTVDFAYIKKQAEYYNKYLKNIILGYEEDKVITPQSIVIRKTSGAKCWNKLNDKDTTGQEAALYYVKYNNIEYPIGIVRGDKFLAKYLPSGTAYFTLTPSGSHPNILGIKDILKNFGNNLKGTYGHNLGLCRATEYRHYYSRYRNTNFPFGFRKNVISRYVPLSHFSDLQVVIPQGFSQYKHWEKDTNENFQEFLDMLNKFRVFPLKITDPEAQPFRTYYTYKYWLPTLYAWGEPCLLSFAYRPPASEIAEFNKHNVLSTITDLITSLPNSTLGGKSLYEMLGISGHKGDSIMHYIWRWDDSSKLKGKYIENLQFDLNLYDTAILNLQQFIRDITTYATNNNLSSGQKDFMLKLFTIYEVLLTFNEKTLGRSLKALDYINEINSKLKSRIGYELTDAEQMHIKASKMISLSVMDKLLQENVSQIKQILALNPHYYYTAFPPNLADIKTLYMFAEEYVEPANFMGSVTAWQLIQDTVESLYTVNLPQDLKSINLDKNQTTNQHVDIMFPLGNFDSFKVPLLTNVKYQIGNTTYTLLEVNGDKYTIIERLGLLPVIYLRDGDIDLSTIPLLEKRYNDINTPPESLENYQLFSTKKQWVSYLDGMLFDPVTVFKLTCVADIGQDWDAIKEAIKNSTIKDKQKLIDFLYSSFPLKNSDIDYVEHLIDLNTTTNSQTIEDKEQLFKETMQEIQSEDPFLYGIIQRKGISKIEDLLNIYKKDTEFADNIDCLIDLKPELHTKLMNLIYNC